MRSRNTRLRPSPDVVFRRLPEWGRCLAYTPASPEVYELNTPSWLIVELCDTYEEDDAEAEFIAIMGRRGGADWAGRHFREARDVLLEKGILERAPPDELIGLAPDTSSARERGL
jgi:hypothetical protein